MIHQYKSNGYHIVLDVNSGAVHVVDELCYDVIAALSGGVKEPAAAELRDPEVLEELVQKLGVSYGEDDIVSIILILMNQGFLPLSFENKNNKKQRPKDRCLNLLYESDYFFCSQV